MEDGTLVEECLPTDKRAFELRCGCGLARHLAERLGTRVDAARIDNDELRGDVCLTGPRIKDVDVQVVEATLGAESKIDKMHEWSSWAAQAAKVLGAVDTTDLKGTELWFCDPQPPKAMKKSLPEYIEKARSQTEKAISGPQSLNGPLGRVQLVRAKEPEAPFRGVFWSMTFDGLGIRNAVTKKAEKEYSPGTCLLVVSTLDLSPGRDVVVPDWETGRVAIVNDIDLVRRFLDTQAPPFAVVWRSLLMPWQHGTDDIIVLCGDEQTLLRDLE
jgi:hypothetical protein